MSEAVDGVLDPELLREIGPSSVETLARNPDRWLTAGSLHAIEARARSPLTQRFAVEGVHDAAIRSFCLWFDAPFDRDALFETLQVLTALRGPDLLRVKGIVNVQGEAVPLAIHGVQHVFHPPLHLSHWPDADRRSRIVFIVRSIPREAIERLFAAIGGLAK